VQHVACAGRRKTNRPLSNLNTGVYPPGNLAEKIVIENSTQFYKDQLSLTNPRDALHHDKR